MDEATIFQCLFMNQPGLSRIFVQLTQDADASEILEMAVTWTDGSYYGVYQARVGFKKDGNNEKHCCY